MIEPSKMIGGLLKLDLTPLLEYWMHRMVKTATTDLGKMRSLMKMVSPVVNMETQTFHCGKRKAEMKSAIL